MPLFTLKLILSRFGLSFQVYLLYAIAAQPKSAVCNSTGRVAAVLTLFMLLQHIYSLSPACGCLQLLICSNYPNLNKYSTQYRMCNI